MLTTPVFEFFAQEELARQKVEKENDLADEIKRHWESLRLCWSEWNGPKVDPTSIDGYCSVDTTVVYSITHGENRYHYMAPCRIISASEDLLWFEVEVEYKKDCHCAHYNGERLKLHITDVWAPVYKINRRFPEFDKIVDQVLKNNNQL
jgi:hypothetical protein